MNMTSNDDRPVSFMTQARTRALFRERDEAKDEVASLRRQLRDAQQDADMSRAEMEADTPRPLTADDITDEMVLRFWNAFNGLNDGLEDMQLRDIDEVRTGLSAALTEPTRAWEVEEVEGDLIDILGTGVLNDAAFDILATKLVKLGYRKDANR